MAIIDSLQKISDTVWELPASYKEGMRVPGRIVATEKLVREMEETVYQQISNVATLPGITRYALCMPDGRATTVPFHPGRDISPTLLRVIARDIGMDVRDFLSRR